MRSIARILIVLMMCLTLPTQVLAGITMPFCGEAVAEAATAGHSEHAGHVMDGAMADHDASDHGQAHHASSDSSDCNQCGLCHLACAGALPTFLAPAFSAPFGSVLQAVLQADTSDVLPDRLLRPPRTPLV
jgi:hypothetical protein